MNSYRPSRRFLTILAAVAIPAALLVIAPSGAVAKRVRIDLEGPISKSKDPGYSPMQHLCCFPTYTPTIQIHAQFDNRGGRLPQLIEGEVPRLPTKGRAALVTVYGLWSPCSVREYTSGMGGEEITLKPKKNGTFSGTHNDSVTTEEGTFTSTLTTSGRILGKRTASGTVRSVSVIPPRQPAGTYAEGTCDTGPLSWTAKRVPALTELKRSFDSSLVYPAGL